MTRKDGNTLDIVLMGREYRVACAPEEREALQSAVVFLDEKMRELGEKTKSSGERLAVMTALNLAHELLSIKLPGGFDMQELRRRIGAMQARLDEVMASQEQLF
ncbi:MAG: cell division protein ZapA [Rhodocyclaceae bacterium]|jgi:cell division protein ZapA|nr:cell division protein ZapA [Rhodocyclaceae bacterium]MCP5296265.1 cell division protein ZapA [Zoogloeaceae bacterium]PKO70281.1 MAG: cell division protein ZapA [Betaproteobacteria bacterium HGW-Betaproteobacteria-14]MBX3675753.1 cell division protein ZapA [Rhodocyclaceae bacterium]MBZ0134286.1 cell division protein ZapA [Rhodocyclaceae bacterium]